MPGRLRTYPDMEQDDSYSCGSIFPLWSSNEDNSITVGDEIAETCEPVQVPVEEPLNELKMFLEEHQEQIRSLIQADQPGWEDHMSSALGHVLDIPGYHRDKRGSPSPVLPQQ